MEETEVIISETTETVADESTAIIPEGQEEAAAVSFDAKSELDTLSTHFPFVSGKALPELVNEKRYEELRSLGLSAEEAFLATAKKQGGTYDNRAHLCGSVPKSVKAPVSAMTPHELLEARELFGGISDEEIRSLYQRVTKQK